MKTEEIILTPKVSNFVNSIYRNLIDYGHDSDIEHIWGRDNKLGAEKRAYYVLTSKDLHARDLLGVEAQCRGFLYDAEVKASKINLFLQLESRHERMLLKKRKEIVESYKKQ